MFINVHQVGLATIIYLYNTTIRKNLHESKMYRNRGPTLTLGLGLGRLPVLITDHVLNIMPQI